MMRLGIMCCGSRTAGRPIASSISAKGPFPLALLLRDDDADDVVRRKRRGREVRASLTSPSRATTSRLGQADFACLMVLYLVAASVRKD